MTIIFDGNFSYPVREYHANIPFELDELEISGYTKICLQSWLNQYSKYTSMSLEELSEHWNQVDELDKKAEELLRRIVSEWEGEEIEKFYYFSLCRDKLKLVIYPDGKEKEFS